MCTAGIRWNHFSSIISRFDRYGVSWLKRCPVQFVIVENNRFSCLVWQRLRLRMPRSLTFLIHGGLSPSAPVNGLQAITGLTCSLTCLSAKSQQECQAPWSKQTQWPSVKTNVRSRLNTSSWAKLATLLHSLWEAANDTSGAWHDHRR